MVIGMIMRRFPTDVLALMVAAGEDEFIRVAAPILEEDALKREDLSRIYRMIKDRVAHA